MGRVRAWIEGLLSRPFVILGPAVVVGVLIGETSEEIRTTAASVGLAAGCVISVVLWRTRAPPAFRLAGWLLLGVVAGLARGQFEARDRTERERWMSSRQGDACIEGIVLFAERLPADGSGRQAGGVGIVECDEAEVRVNEARPFTVRVRAPASGPPWKPGDWMRARGRTVVPGPPRNPGEADVRLAWRAADIDARMIAKGVEAIPAAGPSPPRVWVERLRARLGRCIDDACAPDSAGLLRALTLGLRRGIDDDLNTNLRRCGASHVIAVSGLHVALVLPIVWGMTGLGAWSYRARCVAVVAAVGVLAVLTGGQVPVVRCVVLVAVCLMGSAWGRRSNSVIALSFSAGFLALVDPAQVVRPSFQLTFAAVAGLMVLGERLTPAFDEPGSDRSFINRALGVVRTSLTMSVAAWLATFPIVLFHFHQVSGVSSLANLWIIPAIFVATLLGYAIIAVGLVAPPAAHVLGRLADLGCSWIARGADLSANSPLAFDRMAFAPPGVWVAIAALMAVGLIVLRRRRMAGLLLLLCAPALAAFPRSFAAPDGPEIRLQVVDVRRGSATLIRFPDGAWLGYDAGSLDSFDPGGAWIAPCGWESGLRRMDDLVISHPDSDHLNGAEFMIDAFRVRRVWLPCGFEQYPSGAAWVRRVRDGRPELEWKWISPEPAPEVQINAWCRIMAPPNWRAVGVAAPASNDLSLFVLLTIGDRRALLTGDAGSAAVGHFLDENIGEETDVLVAPHHGKRYPGHEALAELRPGWVAVSAPMGYFAPDVVDAFRSRGAEVEITGETGALVYTLRPDSVSVESFFNRGP